MIHHRILYALRGLLEALRFDHAVRLHVLITVLVILVGASVCLTTDQWALLVLTIGMVLAAELGNSALEQLANRLHPARDSAIRQAKDIAAAAVFVSALGAVVVGAFLFLPPILSGQIGACLAF